MSAIAEQLNLGRKTVQKHLLEAPQANKRENVPRQSHSYAAGTVRAASTWAEIQAYVFSMPSRN